MRADRAKQDFQPVRPHYPAYESALNSKSAAGTEPVFKEFLIYGAKYAFPPVRGALVAGVPTACTAATATRQVLPSGTAIILISAPAFLATKFDAFKTRGRCDLPLSQDLEDIIHVVEGHMAIEAEIVACKRDLRACLAALFGGLVALPDFQYICPGWWPRRTSFRRVDTVLRKSLALAAMTLP